MIGDNRFLAACGVKYSAFARRTSRAKPGPLPVGELWVNAPQFYPQELPRYPARVLNRAVKSSWMRGSLSRSSRMRLQACMTVV